MSRATNYVDATRHRKGEWTFAVKDNQTKEQKIIGPATEPQPITQAYDRQVQNHRIGYRGRHLGTSDRYNTPWIGDYFPPGSANGRPSVFTFGTADNPMQTFIHSPARQKAIDKAPKTIEKAKKRINKNRKLAAQHVEGLYGPEGVLTRSASRRFYRAAAEQEAAADRRRKAVPHARKLVKRSAKIAKKSQ
jgi:hypothetical protein